MLLMVEKGPSILKISKIVIYEFQYDYLTPKCGEKTKLCYMYTDSFIVYIKAEYIYSGIGKDVERRFDTSYYEIERPLPKGKS